MDMLPGMPHYAVRIGDTVYAMGGPLSKDRARWLRRWLRELDIADVVAKFRLRFPGQAQLASLELGHKAATLNYDWPLMAGFLVPGDREWRWGEADRLVGDLKAIRDVIYQWQLRQLMISMLWRIVLHPSGLWEPHPPTRIDITLRGEGDS